MARGQGYVTGQGGTRRYEPGLDGLRALAVAAVLAFHDGRLRGGFLGVSTFFTLSGFLITGLLLAEWRVRGRVSLGDFYARRIRRLLPAAVIGVVLAAAVALRLHDAQTSRAFPFDGLAALANVANWRFLTSGQSYTALFSAPSPLQHYWSLAVEEQFYLVLAPLTVALLALLRGRRGALLAVFATIGAASFADAWIVSAHNLDRAYYGTDTRALEFIVGALLAIALADRRLGRRPSRAIAIAGPVALAAMVWANVHAQVTDHALYHGGLLAYAAAGGVVLLAVRERGILRWFCSLAPLRALGRISYGVYVYHWPIFLWLTAQRTGLDPLALTAVRLAVTLGVATLSFWFLELPVRERRVITGRRRLVAPPAALATAAGAALLVGALASTPAVTFAATATPQSVLAAAQHMLTTTTTTANHSTSAPRTTAAPPVRRVLVVGDSVALTLGRGIERWGTQHGVLVWNGGALGCALVDGVLVRSYTGVESRPPDSCNREQSWPKVINEFRPDVVVVLYGTWDVFDVSYDHGHTWEAAGQSDFDTRYRALITGAVQTLGTRGAHVLWLAPPCVGPAPNATDAGAAWYDPSRIDALGALARQVAPTDRMTVSATAHDLGCPVDYRDRPDGAHYSDPGADVVATALGPQILRLGAG
jgi:peptidoglycan/LPS O-acetylase OafA/YrhL